MVLPANTAVMLRINSELSSKTAKEGSMFDLSVADPVMVDGYVVIPMNARAVGEVTWLTGKGAFGKSGKMNIELRYIEVAGRRIPIKGSFRQEGEGNTAATIGGVIAAGVFAGFIIPVGQIFLAAFMALPARANVPLSALVTFITNPFTFPFWALVANKLGAFILKVDLAATGGAAQEEIASGRWAWFIEMFEGVGVTGRRLQGVFGDLLRDHAQFRGFGDVFLRPVRGGGRQQEVGQR